MEERTSVRIECLISCLLCNLILQDSKDRYAVKGRSSFDIIWAIESLQWNVDIAENSYVCRKCLSLLKKKINLEHAHDKCLSKLREIYLNKTSTLQQPHTSTPIKQCAPNPASSPERPPSQTNQANVSFRTEVTVGVFSLYFVFLSK